MSVETTSLSLTASLVCVLAAGDPQQARETVSGLDREKLEAALLELAGQAAQDHPAPRSSSEWLCTESVRLAAATLGTTPDLVFAGRRMRPVTDARAVAQAVMRAHGMSLVEIGSRFGQDHSSVHYSLGKVAANPRLAAAADRIQNRISASGDIA